MYFAAAAPSSSMLSRGALSTCNAVSATCLFSCAAIGFTYKRIVIKKLGKPQADARLTTVCSIFESGACMPSISIRKSSASEIFSVKMEKRFAPAGRVMTRWMYEEDSRSRLVDAVVGSINNLQRVQPTVE